MLFKPDQRNLTYTGPDDIWMAVSDWSTPVSATGFRRLATGTSPTSRDTKLTVIVEEEFEDRLHGRVRGGLLRLSSRPPDRAVAMSLIAQAYESNDIVRIRA